MNARGLHKFIFAFVVLFSASPAFAFDLNITPSEIVPGDVFSIKIQGNGADLAEAEFLGQRITLHPFRENQLLALVPVDVNTSPGEYPVTVRGSSGERTGTVTVKSYQFKTIELTLPEGKVTLSPENQKRAVRESGILKKLWPRQTAAEWEGRFAPPTDTEISTTFGVKRIMNKKRTSVHRGMDFRGETGTPVKAINAGKVVFTDNLFFGGNTLIVDHGMGLFSVYMHLSEFRAAEGDRVSNGQVVGLVGMSGRATGPHLHLSVKLNGISVNPSSLFNLEF